MFALSLFNVALDPRFRSEQRGTLSSGVLSRDRWYGARGLSVERVLSHPEARLGGSWSTRAPHSIWRARIEVSRNQKLLTPTLMRSETPSRHGASGPLPVKIRVAHPFISSHRHGKK